VAVFAPLFAAWQVRGIGGVAGAGGDAAGLGGPLHHGGSGSGTHTPMDIDEGIEIPAEKASIFFNSFVTRDRCYDF
jgi:hypothetical protein